MIKYGFHIFLTVLSFQTLGQVCSGNFGNNIFDSGDFGSGSSQILMDDPQIAPGYIYTTNLPPSDGYYTIASRMQQNQIYGDWLPISDNSNDEDGYMMVVNASFQPGLFYEQTISNLCEDVLYEFSADIINLIRSSSTDRIDPNVSFLLNDEVIFSTGDIPKSERWIRYGFTFSTEQDQTELTLSLRNNAPGGLGNDLALDNITFRPCGSEALILPESIADICDDGEPITISATIVGSAFENTFIQWQQSFDEGVTWVDLEAEVEEDYVFENLQSGTYYYRYLLADSEEKLSNAQCRTFSNTKIINVIPKFNTVTDSVCIGRSYPFDGSNLTIGGTYFDSLQNKIGCDSIVTLNLGFVENDLRGVFNVTDPSCTGSSDSAIEIESLSSNGPYSVLFDFEPLSRPWRTRELPAGSYRFTILDRYSCAFDTVISVIDPPEFEVDLGPDQFLLLGQEFKVDSFVSEPASVYEWQPSTIDCQPPCDSLRELFGSNVTVSLTATSLNGCVDSDEVNITIEDKVEVFIPNVLTPNQDGQNEFFTVYPTEIDAITLINELSIYTRDGIKIFENVDFEHGIPELGWNGTQNSRTVPSGVYYYAATVSFVNGEVRSYTGYVSLLR